MAYAAGNILAVFAELGSVQGINIAASACEINYISYRRREIFLDRFGNRFGSLQLGAVHKAAFDVRFVIP